MDESVLARMKEVEAAVKKLDPSVRAAAFAMMEEYILSDDGSASSVESVRGGAKRSPASRPGSATAFMKRHESEKDHENVLAAAAWWYSQYGNAWFEPNKDLRAIADQAGLTVPVRIDMTIRQLKRDDKPVFRKSGTRYSPTPKGERFLRRQFNVTKGSGTPPVEDA